MAMVNVIEKGPSKSGSAWELYQIDNILAINQVMAVSYVVTTEDGKILLIRTKRG